MGRMTVKRIEATTKPGFYGDGDTLYLRVSPRGTKSWVQRVVVPDGKRHDIGLGGFPVVSLAKARRRAFDNRVSIADGRNPFAEKQADRRKATIPIFREAAEKVYEVNKPRWRNGKHTRDWLQVLVKYAFPVVGNVTVNQIGREDVLRILTPVWTNRPETARRLRQRIRAVLRWCEAHGYVEHNAAGESIAGALPVMPRIRAHFRAMHYSEVAAGLETVEASGASTAAKLCLRFTVLTAARSGEARDAAWAEIDMDAREWRISGSRMKSGADHRVPLAEATLAVLEQARMLDDGSGLLFPSPMKRGRSLSDMTLTKVLRETGLADRATVHGFRSSFRDWCAETGKPREIAEAALAHTVGSVEGAYFRSDLFQRRRRLMDQWAIYVISGSSGKVVSLHG